MKPKRDSVGRIQTNNLIDEKNFSKFDRLTKVANLRKRIFKTKIIKNNMILCKKDHSKN